MIKFNPNINLNYNAEIIYTDIVCLRPFELYLSIDAKLTPLDGQYKAFVIDKCNEVLDEITNHFIVQEQPNLTAFEFYLKKTEEIMVSPGVIPELFFSKLKEYNHNTPLGWSVAMYILAKEEFKNKSFLRKIFNFFNFKK
jgi:hypothetical protein